MAAVDNVILLQWTTFRELSGLYQGLKLKYLSGFSTDFYMWYWGLNPGPCACQAGTLLPEAQLQPFLTDILVAEDLDRFFLRYSI